jgi:hypothetical protein
MQSVEIQPTFRRNMSPPSSESKNKLSRKQSRSITALFVSSIMLVTYLSYSSTLKMEGTYSSETSVEFQRTTWHYIPEDRTILERI